MSPELESLLDLKEKHYRGYLTNEEYIEKVNEVLSNYIKYYKKTNYNDVLDVVGYLKDHHMNAVPYYNWLEEIEQYILKTQSVENENAEYKRVIKIIKEKKVDIGLLTVSSSVEDYNSNFIRINGRIYSLGRALTQEEFDLLKKYI